MKTITYLTEIKSDFWTRQLIFQLCLSLIEIYVPPDVVPGRHIFFAVDNVDFAEDAPDGKRTLHGTAMAIYQRKDHEDLAPELRKLSVFKLPSLWYSILFMAGKIVRHKMSFSGFSFLLLLD